MELRDYLKSIVTKRNDELEDLKKRVEELEKINDTSNDEEELKAASEELDALKAKKAELEKELEEVNAQIAELDQPADDQEQGQRNLNFMNKQERGNKTMTREEMETRAKEFRTSGKMTIGHEETRAMLVSSGKIATPTGVKGINELDNQVSSIVDMVDVVDCEGMGNNKIAYEYTAPKGGVTVEGETYAEGETVTDFVTTTPQTVTTIAYISKQVLKQSNLNYQEKVKKNSLVALRKKVSEIIITKLQASKLCVKMDNLTAINEKTVRNIALTYGGDENVMGNATLFLNKQTLVNLGDVRGSNEKKAVYEITPSDSNPNVGTIKDGGLTVQYCINSNLAENVFIYGQALKFELDLFSDYEVRVSEDFKFDKGMLAIRGDVELDGDVVFKDGFIIATVGTGA